MLSKTSLSGADQHDEVAGQFSQPLIPSEDQRNHLPFPNSSYMEEKDPQFLPTQAFYFQPVFKEAPDNQQPDHELEIKVGMEIEKFGSENPKEEIKIPQLSPENQVSTRSTNQSTPEVQQIKHDTLPTLPNLNPQPESSFFSGEDKKEDGTDQVLELKELCPWEDSEKWAQILNGIEIELQNQSVEENKSGLLPKSKKIHKEGRKSTSPKSKKSKREKGKKRAHQDVILITSPERSSEYLNKIQLIIKHFYYPFKTKQNPTTFKKFSKLLQETLKKYQINSTIINHYLIVKRFKMLFFKIEFAQHGFSPKYTSEYQDAFLEKNSGNESNSQFIQNCLGILKIHFQQIGWNPDYVEEYFEKTRRVSYENVMDREIIIQNYLIFKKFKKIFQKSSSKNSQDLSNYLRYEMFTGIFEPLCQKYKINRESVEEYLVSEIKGGKEGVTKNGLQKEQAKISDQQDLQRLFCLDPTDPAGLIEKKAGSLLGLEIFFREGFYERWIRKTCKKLQGSGDEAEMAYAKEVADFFIQQKENIFREFLPQLAFPLGNNNGPFINN